MQDDEVAEKARPRARGRGCRDPAARLITETPAARTPARAWALHFGKITRQVRTVRANRLEGGEAAVRGTNPEAARVALAGKRSRHSWRKVTTLTTSAHHSPWGVPCIWGARSSPPPAAGETACFLHHGPQPRAGRLSGDDAQLQRVTEGWTFKLITESYFKRLLTLSAPATHPTLAVPGLSVSLVTLIPIRSLRGRPTALARDLALARLFPNHPPPPGRFSPEAPEQRGKGLPPSSACPPGRNKRRFGRRARRQPSLH